MTYAPEIKVRTSRIVANAEHLRRAWKYFGFRDRAPQVDFKARYVVLFVEGGLCSDPGQGRGGRPVLAVAQADDGSILPIFEEPGQVACEASERVRTGFAYAVSLPRGALPPTRVVLGQNSELIGLSSSEVEPARANPESSSTASATLATRNDGTPVWIVRHPDGSASALGADYELMPEWLPGFRVSIGFNLRGRRFDAPFDEWGTHLSGTRSGLDRYSLYVRNGRLEIGDVLGRVPPGKPRVRTESSYSVESSFSSAGAFDGVERRSVREARDARAGALSIVSGQMRLEPGSTAMLCAPDASSTEECAAVREVRTARDCSGYIGGNFAVRSDGEGGFVHVVGLSPDVAYTCRTDEGFRPFWPPGGAWGLRPLTATASFAASSGFAGPEFELGAQASAALRLRHSLPAPGSLRRGLFGDVLELALRARWFDAQGRHGAPAWALGVGPAPLSSNPFGSWATPALLGLVVPEFGVITQHERHRAYLAWRFPIEYRASPLRQRPYTAPERLAWFATPEFVLALGEGVERWHAGAAAGFTVW
ncbi:MAG TPA: hypothetical protein VFQ35_12720 [Polyangiaceae bacterium]|nr:hypothetical protein [Polyangiaceae bacterium]